MNELLTTTNNLMKNAQIPWAICGGFALDLFLGRDTRTHGDIDICVFEKDREKILHYMLLNNWHVYEFRGNGKVRPLDASSASETGRNFMCTNGQCDIVKFYPCEDEGLLWYEFFHTGIKEFNYLEFLFNTADEDYFVFDESLGIKRDISKAILFSGGIPYLAPEIALLHKASRSENAEYQYDFEQAHMHMNDEQKRWFHESLDALYPNGHSWRG